MCEVKLYRDWIASNHITFIPDFLNIGQLVRDYNCHHLRNRQTDRQGPGLEMAVDAV